MNAIFDLVYSLLVWVSRVSGLSYEEVNIIAYYFLVPLVFLALIDRIIRRNVCVCGFVAVWGVFLLLGPSFAGFSDDLFEKSVRFLNALSVLGMNYTVASVVVCVLLPGLLFVVLLHFAFPRLFQRRPSMLDRGTE
jgi:hypothetical protein